MGLWCIDKAVAGVGAGDAQGSVCMWGYPWTGLAGRQGVGWDCGGYAKLCVCWGEPRAGLAGSAAAVNSSGLKELCRESCMALQCYPRLTLKS